MLGRESPFKGYQRYSDPRLTGSRRYVWPSSWGPTYRYSYAICIATSGWAIFMSYVFKRHLESLNREMAEEERRKGVTEEGFRYLT